MGNLQKNKKAVSNALFVGAIVVLLIVCGVIGLTAVNLQNRVDTLQTNYIQLSNDYNNLQQQIRNLQTSVNELNQQIAGTPTPIPVSQTEKVAIQAVSINSSKIATVYTQSLSGRTITIVQGILKDSSGNTVFDTHNEIGASTLAEGGMLREIYLDFSSVTMYSGRAYTVTLVSAEGNSFVSPAFTF